MVRVIVYALFTAFVIWKVEAISLQDAKDSVNRLWSSTISPSIWSSHTDDSHDFICIKDGIFPNLDSCSSYIHCSNGQADYRECPEDKHYRVVTQKCEPKCEVHCNRTIACECGWSSCEEDICFLPLKIGSCVGNTRKWFYDQRTSQCRLFTYTGCGGNKNNFETQQECERSCGHIDDCYAPKVEGLCNGRFSRYYFNPSEGRCLKFTYGGCQGNKNNYKSKKACERRCITRESVAEPPVTVAQPQLMELDSEVRRRPDCSSPPEMGSCKARIPRYYYDNETGKCKKFTYGGCRGNENNYITERQCYRICKPPQREGQTQVTESQPQLTDQRLEDWPEPDCSSPPEKGRCGGSFSRYYYDEEEGECKTFTYGGCKGNRNNYITENQCKRTCKSEESQMKEEIDICRLESDGGPCMLLTTIYFFNFRTGKCEEFIYGGCHGNENRFSTLQSCERTCLRTRNAAISEEQTQVTESQPQLTDQRLEDWPEPDCSSPPEKGRCRGSFSRYYYDEEEGECKTFTYGGCKGNRNNYITENQCKRTCKSEESQMKEEIDICRLESDGGPCMLLTTIYFFNFLTGKCEEFIYGGCHGNENRFSTLQSCERTCLRTREEQTQVTESQPQLTDQRLEDWPEPDCSSPPEKGRCRGSFSRYYYDEEEGECKTFTYGGCKGNRNNYITENQCKRTCKSEESQMKEEIDICRLESDGEPCMLLTNMYFFNFRTGKCEEFIYGGCRGMRTDYAGEGKEMCQMEKDQGPCEGHIPRYFYNSRTGRCERFEYGGCEGNQNNFETFITCATTCQRGNTAKSSVTEAQQPVTEQTSDDESKPNCSSPPEKGPCRYRYTRYYYEEKEGECKAFIYGGCKGNGNNYPTKDHCMRSCPKQEDEAEPPVTEAQIPVTEQILEDWPPVDCTSPPDRGPCTSRIQVYYYDQNEGKCKMFMFGGCDGNWNKYATEERCMEKCKPEGMKTEAASNETEEPELIINCSEPPQQGPCDDYVVKWYYDSQTKKCDTFLYGGCLGTSNKFDTLEQCQKVCSSKSTITEQSSEESYKPDCSSPPRTGHCKASIPRYHYDAATGNCKMFMYGGCGYLGNSYETEEQCLQTCLPQSGKSFLCPQPNGKFAVPYHCRFYYLCRENTARVLKCPLDQAFDSRRSECIPLPQSDCNDK